MADYTIENGRTIPFQDMHVVEGFLDELPDGFIACRAGNHRWSPLTAVENRRYGFWTIYERCDNCKSERWCERSSSRFAVTKPWSINYSEGYLAPRGSGRLTGEARDLVYRQHVTRNFKPKSTTAKNGTPRGQKTRDEIGLKGDI